MKNLDKTRLSIVGHRGVIVLVGLLAVLIWAPVAPGQRGMANRKGVAQLGLKPHVVRISGKVQEIKTHRCEHTTGQAELGTHVILEDKQGRELNVHLGPAPVVAEAVKQLAVGRRLDLLGFRTDQMPPNQYVAKALILGSRFIHLRDSELRPYWSSSNSDDEGQPRYGLAYARRGAALTANGPGRCLLRPGRGRCPNALRAGPTGFCRRRSGWCEQYGKNGGRWFHANSGSRSRSRMETDRFGPRNFNGRRWFRAKASGLAAPR